METLDRHASGLARFEAATSRVDKPWGYEHIYRSEAAVTPAEERQEEGLNHGNTRSSRKWARALRGRDFEGRQALGLRAHLQIGSRRHACRGTSRGGSEPWKHSIVTQVGSRASRPRLRGSTSPGATSTSTDRKPPSRLPRNVKRRV